MKKQNAWAVYNSHSGNVLRTFPTREMARRMRRKRWGDIKAHVAKAPECAGASAENAA